MKARLDYFAKLPELMKAVGELNGKIEGAGLEKSLIHLVKLRASQINGCSFCVNMHSQEARRDGESEQRVYLVAAWRDSPLFTDRERAAFEWTEAVTLISQGGVSDDLYERVRKQFSEEDLVKLTAVVAMINVWNRLSIPFRTPHPVHAARVA